MQRPEPQKDGGDGNHGEIVGGTLLVSAGDPVELLQPVVRAFHAVRFSDFDGNSDDLNLLQRGLLDGSRPLVVAYPHCPGTVTVCDVPVATYVESMTEIRTSLHGCINPDLGRFAEATVASDRYESAGEVVRAALRLLEAAEPALSKDSLHGRGTKRSIP